MDITFTQDLQYRLKSKLGAVTLDAECVVVSPKGAGTAGFEIKAPGEYEVGGISVFGYGEVGATIYVVQAEDLRILYLGSLDKMPSAQVTSELNNIDVVIVGVDKIDAKELSSLLGNLEPYYVLPYGRSIEQFVTIFDHVKTSVKALSMSRASLSEDVTQVIVFE